MDEMKVYVIKEHGDNYHGSRIMPVCYLSYEQARVVAERLEQTQDPCPHDCGHRYWYTVTELTVSDEPRV